MSLRPIHGHVAKATLTVHALSVQVHDLCLERYTSSNLRDTAGMGLCARAIAARAFARWCHLRV